MCCTQIYVVLRSLQGRPVSQPLSLHISVVECCGDSGCGEERKELDFLQVCVCGEGRGQLQASLHVDFMVCGFEEKEIELFPKWLEI